MLKKYYTESLPISTAQDLYINDTSLVYDGAYADVFSDQSDTLTRRNYSEINTLVYSDATRGITEEAFLYKHLKTDIPISIGNSNIVWPIDTFDFFQNIPITVLNDTCLPVKLADMDASNNMLGCVAGSSYSNSDVIFKLNSRSEEIIEAAWLGSGNINNINIDMGLNVYDDEIASYCSSHLEGNVQGGIATIIQPLEKISFVWMDKDTYADDVIFYSPIVFSPQNGKELTTLYLMAAGNTFGGDKAKDGTLEGSSFKYTKEILEGNQAMLEFETQIDGKYINGVDIITFNESGKISEFKVMIRPLQAVQIIHEQMQKMLTQYKNNEQI